MISLFKLCILDSILVSCIFLETCPFLLACQIIYICVCVCVCVCVCARARVYVCVHNISLLFFFCISEVSIVMSPSYLILFIWILSLIFLVSLARDLQILFILIDNHLLVLLNFFLFLILIYFPSDLYYFLHSATCVFAYSFSSYFKW